ncbi:dnaJ homolog subfamily C member 22 [Aplysia californica]|uniref:DnaJ homolog subfamily C member 22 n=1 Tax=Aplysia californica TaxID=6500 RepID=A0ABM0JN27_APLCA|nr:dnaJ homolog subfamily C member 22 [Aplysia californica]XP_035825455.1 dnaJ homolog subfamily C member 22 [Aplysia californica]
MASLVITYILWLFFGWFGWHHVYLDRWNQAIAWFITCGGGFGLGWLRDLWRIPDYVAWINRDKDFEMRHLSSIAEGKPSCSSFRLCGMLGLGFVLSLALCCLTPEYAAKEIDGSPAWYWYLFCRTLFVALVLSGSSLGVYLVSNIGELQCSLLYPLLGSVLAVPWLITNESNVFLPTIFAALVTWWKGLCWRPLRDKQKSSLSSLVLYGIAAFLWLALLFYGIYFTAHITLKDGEKIPVRIVISNFFNSPAWQSTKDTLYALYDSLTRNGFSKTYADAWDLVDFSGEMNALKILGLDRHASYEEIKKACRQMSRQYHPDLQRTEEAKLEGEKMFITVQEACSILTRFRSRKS